MKPKRQFSEEHKKNINESLKGRLFDWGDKISKSLTGKKLSDSHKKNISNALIGRKQTEEHIRNVRKALKGRVFSKERNKKISIANKGKRPSEETRIKMSIAQKKRTDLKGENHPNWKGGVSSENSIQRTIFRQTIQKKVFERDNYTCQLCGQRGGKLQVDHIQSWADYIELRFDINNCRTICMSCHYFITFGKPMSKSIKTWGHNFSQIEGGQHFNT